MCLASLTQCAAVLWNWHGTGLRGTSEVAAGRRPPPPASQHAAAPAAVPSDSRVKLAYHNAKDLSQAGYDMLRCCCG